MTTALLIIAATVIITPFVLALGLLALADRYDERTRDALAPEWSCGVCGEELPSAAAIREHLCPCRCPSLDVHHPSCKRLIRR